jgi:hypothetical protein
MINTRYSPENQTAVEHTKTKMSISIMQLKFKREDGIKYDQYPLDRSTKLKLTCEDIVNTLKWCKMIIRLTGIYIEWSNST